MACPITFEKLETKHIIYPIIAIIFLIIYNYFIYKTKIFKNIVTQHFIKIVFKSFGRSLAIIPYLLFKKEINGVGSSSINEKLYKKDYIYIFAEIFKIKKKIKYFIISLNMIISFLFEILVSYLNYEKDVFFSLWVFEIIYVWIFSYFLLNNKLYRHHYLSIVIIVILGIIINIINKKKDFDLNNLIISLGVDILFSLNIVINKYLIDTLSFTEYQICSYEGLFCLILSIIGLIIFTEFNIGKENDFFEYYDKIDGKEIIPIFIWSICHLIIYLFSLMTIKYYTVFHIFLLLIVNEGNFYLYSLSQWKLYVNLIVYTFIFIMFLVFNENIELNFFGLKEYTKNNIIKRANIDYTKNKDNKDQDNDDLNDIYFENSFEKSNNEHSIEFGRYKFNISDDYFLIE